MISVKQKAILHVAKAKLQMTDNQYRSCLVHLAGVESSTDLVRAGFETLMGFFEWKGFAPLAAQGPSFGDRPGMASFAQIELIRALWEEYTRGAAGEAELNKWLERSFKVSSLRFLTKAAAPKVITGLKAMKARSRAA